MPTYPACRRWALLLLVPALAGCGRNDIQVYRVSKEQPQASAPDNAQAQNMGMPAGHADLSGAPRIQCKAPSGWEEAPAGQMRVASFRVKGDTGKQADVSVIPLPGLAGSDLDNVNRWRGQVGQPPVTDSELPKVAQPVEIGGQTAQLYEQAGQNPSSGEKERILAAVLRRDGVAWFFKMTGDEALVSQQKPAFVEFLKSVSFPEGATTSATPELPPSHPPIGGGLLSAQDSAAGVGTSQGKPAWQVPAGWQELPGGQFLVAKFRVGSPDAGQADINVSMSAGDGGGVAANVNRWRGQLGLGQLLDADLAKSMNAIDAGTGKAILTEMSGTDARTGQKAKLVAAIVPQSGRTWFYKLMGSETVVGQQKDAFTKFVQTAKYP